MDEGESVALADSKLDAVIGQHRMDLVGYGGDQVAKESGGDHLVGFFVQLGIGDRADAVDGDEQA
jgi:hypothetical protein